MNMGFISVFISVVVNISLNWS